MRTFFLNTFLCCILGAIPLFVRGQNAPHADPVLRIPNPQFGNFILNPSGGNATQTHQHSGQNGQTNYFECGFDQMRARLAHTHPQREQVQSELELNYQRHLRSLHQQAQPRTVLTVPVVFHIIHNNGISNISNARINTALQYLNDAFANRGTFQAPNGTDIEIQFCLAQRTPDNNFTDGVNREISPLTVMDKDNDDAALKNIIRWNPSQYINVWVVDEIIGGTAGYAYLPSSHGNNEDGVVIEDDWVGVSQATSMVLTHEMGHYFGLFHTFEAGCPNADCTANGDKVCDTNPDNTTARPPCNTPGNSCTTDADDLSANNPFRPVANGGQGDQPDQIQNYMDYSDFACYDRFTAGQKTRMRFFLNGARVSLLSSNGCTPACNNFISLDIASDSMTVSRGNTFTIFKNVLGATIFRWYIDGVLTFTTTNPTFNFPNMGRYTIRLEVGNADVNCFAVDSILIRVRCQAVASIPSFGGNAGSANFSGSATGSTDFEWFVNGLPTGNTTPNYSYNYSSVGTQVIQFVVRHPSGCADTATRLNTHNCPVRPAIRSTPVGMDIPNQVITLNAASSNSTSAVTWTLNGVQISTNFSPTFTVPSRGSFQLCLIGANAYCQAQVCQTIYVLPDTNNCGSTYLKSFSNNAGGWDILASRNGGYYISGYKADSSLILHTNANGNIIWQKTFKFTNATSEQIHNLAEDSNGNLVGLGYGGTAAPYNVFIFKYSPSPHTILWANSYTSNEKLFSDIFESAPGGNYLVVGQTQGAVFGTSDGIYTEFDRNTGGIFSTRRHNLGDQDALTRNTSQNNLIFSIGSHTNGTGAGNTRATITKTNRLGSFPNNVLWSKSYIYNNAANTQRKGADLVLDGNSLVGLEYGDNNGTNLSNATTSLFKTDTSGNLIWTKQYNIANATNQTPLRVLNLPNGYVIAGHCDLAGVKQAFMIGTNKSGNLQWAKAYGSGSASLFRDAVARGKDIFAVGSTNTNSLLLTKLDSAGALNTTLTCASIQTLTVNETNPPNVQTNFTATISNMSLSVLGLSLNSQNTALSEQIACSSPCVLYEICDNGIDDDFDNLIDCSDTTECQCNPCSVGSGNIWLFGNRAGLDFQTDPPTILTSSAMNTQEGSAVYNDINGKMLFFTDGVTVWDRTYTTMTNGTGLLGHASSAQSALIVPHPGDINLFYIFTTPAQVGAGSTNNGMRYSILDMRLRNGYGDITATKNIPLLLNATERLTGVKHCNGRDYWVVTTEYNTNNFYIYLVDNNGLNPLPTIQPLGQATTTASLNPNEDCIGILKFSSDTRRLAQSFRTARGISLYDFDNSTGIISNPKFITDPEWIDPYGVEFSPNSDILYFISCMRGIIQVDATASSVAALNASVVTVSTNGSVIGYSGLQRAPNGKLYMRGGTSGSHLGVINNPDIRGISCNYQDNAIALAPGAMNLGFCNFMADVYKSVVPPTIIGEDSVCMPFSTPARYRIAAKKPCNVDTIIWTLKGQSSLLSQTDSTAVVQHVGIGFDTLVVTFFGACANTQDTMIIQKFAPTTLSLPNDTVLCENAPVALVASVQNVVSLRWQNGSTDAVYTADQAGWHKVQVIGACGQILRDSVLVTYNPLLIPHIPDTTVCIGDTLRIQLANTFNYNWSPNVRISCITCSNPAFYPNVATTYIGVTFNPTTGCTAVDTFTITPVPCTPDTIRIDTTICPYQTYAFRGQNYAPNSLDTIRVFTSIGALDSIFYIQVRSNPLPSNTDFQNTVVVGQVLCNGNNTGSLSFNWLGGAQPYTYLWSNGRSTSNITGLSSGLYTITVSDARHCTATFSTSISQPAPLALTVTNASSACSGILSANATPSGGVSAYAYLWSNGNTNANITVTTTGLYSLTTTDANLCSVSSNISISTPAGIGLTVNNSPNLCSGNSNLSVSTQNALQPLGYIWSNGSTSSSLSGINNGIYFLTISDANGCTATAQTTASAPAILQVSITETSLSCVAGASAAAAASNGTAPYAYLWSNASTNNPINNLSNNPSLTVTDANGCTVTSSLILNPNRPRGVSFNILSTTLGCGVALSANVQTGTSPLSYLWSTGATAQTLNNPTTGVYTLSISDASGCSANQSTTVTLVGAPNLSAYIGQINTQDTSIFLGETIQIGAGSNQSGLAYVWSELNNPSQAGISTPNLANSAANPNQNGNYIFVISATVAGQNCSATDTVRLLVRAYDAIQLPTAFSPNNDGENDFYRPIGLDIQHIQAFRIHNRWGQILYDSPQLSGGGWDGTFNGSLQARDVYISTLIYKRPQDAQATELRIEFTLLR